MKVKITVSDFELNVDMDESLFSVKPPAGYKVTVVRQTHESPPGESDLVQAFQPYVESNGKYPDSLDQMMEWFDTEISKEWIWEICTPLSGKLDEKKKRKVEEFLHSHGILRSTIRRRRSRARRRKRSWRTSSTRSWTTLRIGTKLLQERRI